jgi:hypothetical protein
MLSVEVPERPHLFAAEQRPEPSIQRCSISYLIHGSSRLQPRIPVESIRRDLSASAKSSLCTAGLVLATGPGNPPQVRVLTGGSVQFGSHLAKSPNRVVLAGLLPGPDINPRFFGRVVPGPRVHFTIPPYSSKFCSN